MNQLMFSLPPPPMLAITMKVNEHHTHYTPPPTNSSPSLIQADYSSLYGLHFHSDEIMCSFSPNITVETNINLSVISVYIYLPRVSQERPFMLPKTWVPYGFEY